MLKEIIRARGVLDPEKILFRDDLSKPHRSSSSLFDRRWSARILPKPLRYTRENAPRRRGDIAEIFRTLRGPLRIVMWSG
jgi:hypothetical protein